MSIVKGQLQDVPYSSELTRSALALSHKQDPVQIFRAALLGSGGGVNAAPRMTGSRNLSFVGERVHCQNLERAYGKLALKPGNWGIPR